MSQILEGQGKFCGWKFIFFILRKLAIFFENANFDIDFHRQNLFVILLRYFSLVLQHLSYNLETDSSLHLISIKTYTILTQESAVCPALSRAPLWSFLAAPT